VTTRIVVLSDTHVPRRAKSIPERVLTELERADLILHLGDLTEESVLHELEKYAPVRAVHGNNDSPDLKSLLPLRDRFHIEGHSIAMLHGHKGGKTALGAAMQMTGAEVVLFGHSHRPSIQNHNGTILFNPGSPTDPRWSPYRAFGTLEIGTDVRPSIVRLNGN
jgi:putative phosphoesterase